MLNDIKVNFDSGGGITIMTHNYCHYYNNPEEAGLDYFSILGGEDPSNWDGNQPEHRFFDEQNDYGSSFGTFTKIVKDNLRMKIEKARSNSDVEMGRKYYEFLYSILEFEYELAFS